LESIDLTAINMSSIINMSYMFSDCVQLKTIEFSKSENRYNIIEMNNTFANCISLSSLDLSFIYADGNINLNQCFSNCTSLKEINIINLKTTESQNTYNFLENVSLERCLYHSNDNVNNGNSLTNKYCQQYIGYHKCGPCLNENSNEYCTMNINGDNFNFYYLIFEKELPISERQCYWSKDYANFLGYTLIYNDNNDGINYYANYCDYFCDECSENQYGCIKCKNNLYPIDTEYNDYSNNINQYFYCYKKVNMKNYYFDEDLKQFIKCNEKCSECSSGIDV
jgi:hypothetical protein